MFDITGTGPSSIRAVFQGPTVRNGLSQPGSGGGIRVGNADLVVRDCVITGNRTLSNGGGISNFERPGTGNVTLIRSIVSRNVAFCGGGIEIQSADGESRLIIRDSTIRRNLAARNAGGISAITMDLINCIVADNHAAADGGGLYAPEMNLTNCTVTANTATNAGGGIIADTARLTNCNVTANTPTVAVGSERVTNRPTAPSPARRAADGGGINAFDTATEELQRHGNSAGHHGGGLS